MPKRKHKQTLQPQQTLQPRQSKQSLQTQPKKPRIFHSSPIIFDKYQQKTLELVHNTVKTLHIGSIPKKKIESDDTIVIQDSNIDTLHISHCSFNTLQINNCNILLITLDSSNITNNIIKYSTINSVYTLNCRFLKYYIHNNHSIKSIDIDNKLESSDNEFLIENFIIYENNIFSLRLNECTITKKIIIEKNKFNNTQEDSETDDMSSYSSDTPPDNIQILDCDIVECNIKENVVNCVYILNKYPQKNQQDQKEQEQNKQQKSVSSMIVQNDQNKQQKSISSMIAQKDQNEQHNSISSMILEKDQNEQKVNFTNVVGPPLGNKIVITNNKTGDEEYYILNITDHIVDEIYVIDVPSVLHLESNTCKNLYLKVPECKELYIKTVNLNNFSYYVPIVDYFLFHNPLISKVHLDLPLCTNLDVNLPLCEELYIIARKLINFLYFIPIVKIVNFEFFSIPSLNLNLPLCETFSVLASECTNLKFEGENCQLLDLKLQKTIYLDLITPKCIYLTVLGYTNTSNLVSKLNFLNMKHIHLDNCDNFLLENYIGKDVIESIHIKSLRYNYIRNFIDILPQLTKLQKFTVDTVYEIPSINHESINDKSRYFKLNYSLLFFSYGEYFKVHPRNFIFNAYINKYFPDLDTIDFSEIRKRIEDIHKKQKENQMTGNRNTDELPTFNFIASESTTLQNKFSDIERQKEVKNELIDKIKYILEYKLWMKNYELLKPFQKTKEFTLQPQQRSYLNNGLKMNYKYTQTSFRNNSMFESIQNQQQNMNINKKIETIMKQIQDIKNKKSLTSKQGKTKIPLALRKYCKVHKTIYNDIYKCPLCKEEGKI
jgi:hypothetical protein